MVLQVGAKSLVKYACAITFSLSLVCTTGRVTDVIKRPVIWHTLIYYRDQIQSLPRADPSKEIFSTVAFAACMAFNLIEFTCFVVIFLEMHKHHKRQVSLCLSNKPKIARQKKRRNVITTAGHFASWLVEMMLFGVIQTRIMVHRELLGPLARWIFVLFLPSFNYTIFPLVQALTSQDLREHIFSLELWCKPTCLCLKCKATEVHEEIGPEVVQNGHVIHETHL